MGRDTLEGHAGMNQDILFIKNDMVVPFPPAYSRYEPCGA